ncbi:Arc family DNA-binding protein [Sulfitobacter faviae]|nr:Arc family DNA-binding protein [Sulfitobacter faviae]WCE67979.1 Arc family DNA-binding protein [Sulfitobacter faviae]
MEQKQFKLMIPRDVKDWLASQAKKNMRSQSSEIVMALREKMEAEQAQA